MKVEKVTADNLRYIAERMRDRDLAEFRAMSYFDDRADAARFLVQNYADYPGLDCVTLDDGTPVGAGGCIWIRPNVASMLFFATDNFDKIVVSLTRHSHKNIFAPAKALAHRIECFSLASYTQMQQWVELFGLRPEATLRQYGKNGEDFIVYAWLKDQDEAGKTEQ
jgi:hypothetical protein